MPAKNFNSHLFFVHGAFHCNRVPIRWIRTILAYSYINCTSHQYRSRSVDSIPDFSDFKLTSARFYFFLRFAHLIIRSFVVLNLWYYGFRVVYSYANVCTHTSYTYVRLPTNAYYSHGYEKYSAKTHDDDWQHSSEF